MGWVGLPSLFRFTVPPSPSPDLSLHFKGQVLVMAGSVLSLCPVLKIKDLATVSNTLVTFRLDYTVMYSIRGDAFERA